MPARTAIDWARGYSASWRVFRVNRDTWADAELVTGVTSITVERSGDEDSPTLESGSLSVDISPGDTFDTGYYRVVMNATQNGVTERVDVCTLMCESTDGDIDRGVDMTNVLCRSVLYPASVTGLESGSYAPAGIDGVAYVADMLRSAINAPVETEGSFRLDEHYVFDSGSQVLSAAWKVLDAGNYVMQVMGDGTVRIVPKPQEPDLVLDRANARLLHPGIHHQTDYSDVPNRYTAVSNGLEAVAVNSDPSSPTSTVTRGWVHDVRDESPTRVNGETLPAYAERKLEEASVVYDSRTYSREYWPGVHPYSLVRGSIASVGLDGDLRVVRQSLTCERGITVEEESRREVYAWTR